MVSSTVSSCDIWKTGDELMVERLRDFRSVCSESIGWVAHWKKSSLLGVTIVQGWTYIHDNHDKWPIRTFVRSISDPPLVYQFICNSRSLLSCKCFVTTTKAPNICSPSTCPSLLDVAETCCSTQLLQHYFVNLSLASLVTYDWSLDQELRRFERIKDCYSVGSVLLSKYMFHWCPSNSLASADFAVTGAIMFLWVNLLTRIRGIINLECFFGERVHIFFASRLFLCMYPNFSMFPMI